jgi:hypothetical protein
VVIMMARVYLVVLIVAALAMTGWLIHADGRDAGREAVQAAWEAERITQARQRTEALQQARQREVALQTTVDRLRGEHHEAIHRVTAERDALVRELRRRAARPTGYMPAAAQAAGAQPAAGCSADQLYREDAEGLVGIAADAELVRASLMECRGAYRAAASE